MKQSTKEKNFWNEEWFCTFGVNLKVNALRFGFVIDFHKSYSWVSFSVVVVHTSQWLWSGVVVSMHQVNTKLVHFWEPHSRRFFIWGAILKRGSGRVRTTERQHTYQNKRIVLTQFSALFFRLFVHPWLWSQKKKKKKTWSAGKYSIFCLRTPCEHTQVLYTKNK